MKLKKKWQENFIEMKLIHLRYYLTLQETPMKNLINTCHVLKKSMKLLRECHLRNHTVIYTEGFKRKIVLNKQKNLTNIYYPLNSQVKLRTLKNLGLTKQINGVQQLLPGFDAAFKIY